MADSQIKTATLNDYLNNYTVSLKSYQMIRKEVSFLSTLHHENLTQLCGVSTNPFMLLIELAPLGSLHTIIKEYRAADMALASSVLCKSMTQVSNVFIIKNMSHISKQPSCGERVQPQGEKRCKIRGGGQEMGVIVS